MSQPRLNNVETALFRGLWIVAASDVKKLDAFFLLKDKWSNLEKDFYVDQQEVKRFLRHEGKEYEVILMQPVRILQAATELGLSFRVHRAAGLRVVLVKEWHEATKEELISNG